jgi:hypothetical protein
MAMSYVSAFMQAALIATGLAHPAPGQTALNNVLTGDRPCTTIFQMAAQKSDGGPACFPAKTAEATAPSINGKPGAVGAFNAVMDVQAAVVAPVAPVQLRAPDTVGLASIAPAQRVQLLKPETVQLRPLAPAGQGARP